MLTWGSIAAHLQNVHSGRPSFLSASDSTILSCSSSAQFHKEQSIFECFCMTNQGLAKHAKYVTVGYDHVRILAPEAAQENEKEKLSLVEVGILAGSQSLEN